MTRKKITYGDINALLEEEGFKSSPLKGPHVVFRNSEAQATLVLPDVKSTLAASRLHLAMLRRTLVDFGLLSEEDFDRWSADPKRFVAA